MSALVEIKNLTISFPEDGSNFEAVKNVSFTVEEGEIVGVVGESGSGKSMSALALMGLLKKNAQIPNGEILFRGKNLLTCFLKHYRLNIGTDKRNYKYSCINRNYGKQTPHFKIVLDHALYIADKKRRYDLICDGKDHQQKDENKAFYMRLCIYQKSADYLAVLHISVKADGLLFILDGEICRKENDGKCTNNGTDDYKWKKFTHLRSPPFLFRCRSPRLHPASEDQRYFCKHRSFHKALHECPRQLSYRRR